MKTIFKIVLALFLALGTSFATDDYDDDWERKAVPKKFLSQGCKTISKDIWNEGKVSYRQTTILNM